MIETNEEDIEEWYMNHQEKDPLDYVCKIKILKEKDTGKKIIQTLAI